MLVRVRDTGEVMYLPQWEQTFPETSFPNPIPTETINEFGADVVLDGPYPTATTYQYVISGPVVLQDGQWYTSFIVEDIDANQIAAKNVELAANIKATGKQILAGTDWAAIASVGDPAESTPYLTNRQEFLEYRSAVRAIVLNPTFDATFPTAPVEQWSS